MIFNDNHCGTKVLKVAILGGAYDSAVGRAHWAAIGLDRRFELVAGCFSLDAENNLHTARLYKIDQDRLYTSYSELLEKEAGKVDAIIILTPTDQHKQHVEAGIKAGIPVICEKALVTSSEDAEDLRDLINDASYLAVTYNYTGYPMLRELKQLISDGYLGQVQQVQIEMPQESFGRKTAQGEPIVPQDWRLRDGSIPTISLDLGVHIHNVIRFICSEKVLELVAFTNSYGNFRQVVDNVNCLARCENDISCNIWFSKTALGYRNGLRLRIFGTLGSAVWHQENSELLRLCDSKGTLSILDRGSSELCIANQDRYSRFKAGHPSGFIEAFANYYYDVADQILQVQKNGSAEANEYVFGIEEACEGLKFLEAIEESKKRGEWVVIQ